MTIFDPEPRLTWLFAMTHPDDELSVCCWIKRLADVGAEVWMSWTHSNPEREEEARSAARLLGVPQDRLRFFCAPDGHVAEHIAELVPGFKGLIQEVRPDRVVCGAFEQGHLDHDATNFLVNRAFEGPVLESPFYHTYTHLIQTINRFADPSGEEVIELCDAEQEFKRVLSRAYPSQRIGDLLIWYEVWRALCGQRADLWKSERLRLQTHREYRQPNLPPALAARVALSKSWHRWLRAVEPVL